MPVPSTMLLKGGVLLIHDEKDRVVPTAADMLIDGNGLIAQIGPDIGESAASTVIDCTDKIISPGFIDTHRHMWQTAAKGRHANQTLLESMPVGSAPASIYSPDELFWSQLSGCLESLDAGTTTFVDYPHALVSPEHTYKLIQATASSGLRSVFCFCPTATVTSWEPLEFDHHSTTAPWVANTFGQLAKQQPFADGRITLGLAFDGIEGMSAETIHDIHARAAAADVRLITTHGLGGPITGGLPRTLALLKQHGVLGSHHLIAHCNNAAPEDAMLLRESGASISSSPATELQMGHGEPIALQAEFLQHASLGVDCHSIVHASIPGQMNTLLQYTRGKRHAALARQNKDGQPIADVTAGTWSLSAGPMVEQVYNLGTVLGARAINMQDSLGRIKVGYKADLAVFSATSPAMLGAAQQDPVAAIVLHSTPADIEAVLVNGVLRKQYHALRPVDVVPMAAIDPSVQLLQSGPETAGGTTVA